MITDEELEKIYSKIPKINCKTGCSACCGPVVFGPREDKRIKLWLKKRGLKPNVMTNTKCPYLQNNRCKIYPVRPLLCRLYGVTNHQSDICDMTCHFAKAEKMISNEEATEMMEKVFAT